MSERGERSNGGHRARAAWSAWFAPRYIAVASPSPDSNQEWNRAWPAVTEDYALLKVLFVLRQQRHRSPARVHPFQYDRTSLTPLDFSGLSDAHVIFIVGIRLIRHYQYARWVDGGTVLWLSRRKPLAASTSPAACDSTC